MTIADVDRLVVQDDTAAARLWPRLGPKVRAAYLADRDAWVALRRQADAGQPPAANVLAAKERAFAGWARAFRAAGHKRRHPVAAGPGQVATKPTPARPVPAPAALGALAVATPAGAPTPLVARSGPSVGTAVAGGLVLASLIAFAARRKHQ